MSQPFANAVRTGVQNPPVDPEALDEAQQSVIIDWSSIMAAIAMQTLQREAPTLVTPVVNRIIEQTPARLKSTTVIRHDIPKATTPFMWAGVLIGAVAGFVLALVMTLAVNTNAITNQVSGQIVTVSSAFDSAWVEVPFILFITVGFAAIGGWVGSLFRREITTHQVIPAADTNKKDV